MNREQAKELIRDTLESPFDKKKFIVFIKNLLNKIDESKAFHARGYVKQAFKQVVEVIKTYERLGTYTAPSGEKIDILVVYLQKDNSLERARTTMRNFVAKYLKDRGEKDAALVAFISPDEEDWRFSLVKMDYRWEKTPSGMMKVKEEFTPARRWSYLVGKNEKSHTAQSRLVSILEDDEHNPTLAQLEEAFNIEPVTKEFFDKYRDLLIRTVDALDNLVSTTDGLSRQFNEKNINTVDFAKKLLGQIVFLYFLQKKGWFGVERDAEWGTGPKDFLRRLFNKEYGDYKNFFNDILEPLFYEALARERDDNFYSRFNCKIPFLNGGLFEPIGGYDWVHTDILLPDDLFSNSRRTPEGDIGDGILDVFDRFNFTVKEDEPLEREVAIDPELLGKLYEKFNAIRPDNFYEYKKALRSGKRSLEKQFNKKFGVYYTPREIVHYMCQQSLIYYLSSELEGKVSKEDIEKFIKFGEQFTENEATALIKEQRIKEGKQKTSDYELKLPESIRKNAKFIDDKLRDIKICDPAIGSGAFPVGMMHEIVKTRNVLSAYLPTTDGFSHQDRNTYNFKRECIENSLYGVDIDAGACEVAKLRLWLSLIVDEEDIRKIKPLPNLDYKIVCGNSLLGVEKDLFNIELFNQLEKLKPLYFNETNSAKKQEYKKQIEELISKITKGRKEFDFEVYFSEVFHEKKIEKNWRAYHITWPTYGSRVNDYEIPGTQSLQPTASSVENPKSKQPTALAVGCEDLQKKIKPVFLSDDSRKIIAEAIAKKIKEKNYRVLAVNVLKNHVHCIVVCEEQELPGLIHDLKGASSYEHNRQLKLSVAGEGRQTKLWAKGSSKILIEKDEHLVRAIEYVQYNHQKHNLSDIGSSLFNRQLKQAVVSLEKAFDPVIKPGGFDVVIANPPYGNLLNKQEKNIMKNIYSFSTFYDISSPFIERSFNLLKDKGNLVFIITYAITFNKAFSESRQLMATGFENSYIYTFDRDRCAIFKSMTQTVSIIKCFNKNATNKKGIFTSRMFRETPDIDHIQVSNADKFLLPIGASYSIRHRLPKIGEQINVDILKKLLELKHKTCEVIGKGSDCIWIRTSGNYWYNAWTKSPYKSSEIKKIKVVSPYRNFMVLLMNSSLFYFWFRIFSDGRHMNMDILEQMPIPDKRTVERYDRLIPNSADFT